MNKNVLLTVLLVAVMCQPVSAVSSTLMMSKAFTTVTLFVKNHKIACATVGVSALLVGGYKWALKKMAQANARIEPELDQLVAEVKQIVAQDKYVTVERIENSSDDLWPTIKKGKYKFLNALYPKLIELADAYMARMNDLLKPNMTHDQRVIAEHEASKAAHEFNHYAFYDVLCKVGARSEKDAWTVNDIRIKTLKGDARKAEFNRLSSVK